MATRFPNSGDFRDFLLHEMLFSLIGGRFSGSLEIEYAEGTRIFHFDNGSLCAASSTAASEQLDRLIERDKSPGLPENKRKLIEDRVASGQKYSKAMVESGLMSATELLDYNRRQASFILAGGLASAPQRYRLIAGKSAQYRPLAIDPYAVIRKSVLNDLDPAVVHARLGKEDTLYLAAESSDPAARTVRDDAEIRAILSHLDGSRSLGEVMKKVGLNPDRTARNLLFLKLVGMLSPAGGAGNYIESAEKLAAATGGGGRHQRTESFREEENADILKLLGDDDEAFVEEPHPSRERPTRRTRTDDDDDVILSASPASTPRPRGRYQEMPADVMAPATPPLFGDILSQQAEPVKKPAGNRFLRLVLPAVLILISVSAIAVIFIAMQQRTGSPSGQDLSFYPEGMKTEQLPLDQEFSEKKAEEPVAQVEIPLEKTEADTVPLKPANSAPSPNTKSQPQTPAETRVVRESEPAQKPAEKAAPPAQKPAEKPTTVRRNIEPARTQSVRPSATEPRQDGDPIVDNRSWDEAQPLALEKGVAGRWREAAAIWRGPVSRLSRGSFTILVSQTDTSTFVSSVFERFANSATLRDQFFVTTGPRNSFNICWGFFPDRAAAQRGLAALPERVKQFKPAVRPLDDLR